MFTVKPNFGRAANIWLENRQKQNVTNIFLENGKWNQIHGEKISTKLYVSALT